MFFVALGAAVRLSVAVWITCAISFFFDVQGNAGLWISSDVIP
jgi:hypothetical protein